MSLRLGFTVRKSKSRSRRAGLLFPVGRIHRICRKGPWVGSRIAKGAPVYLTAVLEYLVAEMVEQAGLVARLVGKERILPRHIMLAVTRDTELDILCKGVIMQGGGMDKSEKIEFDEADMAGDLSRPTQLSLRKEVKRQEKRKGTGKWGEKRKHQSVHKKKKIDPLGRKPGLFVDLTVSSPGCVVELTGNEKAGDLSRLTQMSNSDQTGGEKAKDLNRPTQLSMGETDQFQKRKETEKWGDKRKNRPVHKKKVDLSGRKSGMFVDLTESSSGCVVDLTGRENAGDLSSPTEMSLGIMEKIQEKRVLGTEAISEKRKIQSVPREFNLPGRKPGMSVDLTESSPEAVIDPTGGEKLNAFEKEMFRIGEYFDKKHKKGREEASKVGHGQMKDSIHKTQQKIGSSNEKGVGKSYTRKESNKEKGAFGLVNKDKRKELLKRVRKD